jgi:hypothetical protein
MQVLLTIGGDGDLDALEAGLVERATDFVRAGNATRAAVNVLARGEDSDRLEAFTNERDAVAVVKLWDPVFEGDEVAFPLPDAATLVGAYQSEEIVQKDYEQDWASGTPSPGIKLVCFVHRRPDISHQQYLDHWGQNHGPLAVRVQPGFWHYVQNHVTDWLTDTTPDFDGLGELHFRTVDDVFSGMYADDDAERLIFEDIPRFMVNETSTVLVARETLIER